jgi:copper transporter 1
MPFILAQDIPRGAIHAMQALIGYALMLAVMCVPPFYGLEKVLLKLGCSVSYRTYQAAYIIPIILGLGLGEVMFGRMGSAGPHASH